MELDTFYGTLLRSRYRLHTSMAFAFEDPGKVNMQTGGTGWMIALDEAGTVINRIDPGDFFPEEMRYLLACPGNRDFFLALNGCLDFHMRKNHMVWFNQDTDYLHSEEEELTRQLKMLVDQYGEIIGLAGIARMVLPGPSPVIAMR